MYELNFIVIFCINLFYYYVLILYFIYKIILCLCVVINKFVLIIISLCYMYIELNGKIFFYLLNYF